MEKEASVGEGIFHGTLPCHKLGEITALSQEDYGSGGLVPQRLLYVKGLYRTDFVATMDVVETLN